MSSNFPFEPLEGVVQIHENEMAHVQEERFFIYDESGKQIGRAIQANRSAASSYKWILVDVTCNQPIPAVIELASEFWTIDGAVFHEGYGFLTATTHIEPVDTTPRKQFVMTNYDAIQTNIENLYIYRYVTIEQRS